MSQRRAISERFQLDPVKSFHDTHVSSFYVIAASASHSVLFCGRVYSLLKPWMLSSQYSVSTQNTTPRLLKQRSIHSVPPLTHINHFTEKGVPGLFSPKAFKMSWVEYQNVLVRNLNRLIAGEVFRPTLTRVLTDCRPQRPTLRTRHR